MLVKIFWLLMRIVSKNVYAEKQQQHGKRKEEEKDDREENSKHFK